MSRLATRTVLLLTVLTSGCSAVGRTASPAASTSAAAPSSPSWTNWDEPADYRFTVESSCGERSFIGVYRVTVRGGEVVAADHDDRLTGDTIALGPGDLEAVPSLGDMLDQALDASGDPGAGEVAVETDPADGHPTLVSIDHVREAIDDESCYAIQVYAPGS